MRTTFIALPLTAAVADLLAIIVVFLGAKDRRAGYSFAGIACCMFLWSAFLATESILTAPEAQMALLRALSLGLVLLPAAIAYNAAVWSDHKVGITVRISCVVAVLLAILQVRAGSVIDGFERVKWGSMAHPGPLYPVWWLLVSATLIGGARKCRQARSISASPAVRLRVRYWLLSVAVTFPFCATNAAANYGLPILPLGFLGNIALVATMTYAAVRHRVMDIDRFIMRAAASLLASVAVVLPIAGALIWLHHLPAGSSGSLVVGSLLLAALVSLLVFSRFRSYLEQAVESSLFPKRHAARDAIRSLTADLVKLPPISDLHARIAAALVRGLGVSGVAVYRSTRQPAVFALAHAEGKIPAPSSVRLGDTSPQVRLGDTSSHPAALPVGDTEDGTPDAPQWEAQVPVCTNGTDLGFIALGPKESGACIDDSDVTLLKVVAAQLAIALQNADYVRLIETQKAKIDELRKRLEAENVSLRAEVRSVSQFKEIIGASPPLQRTLLLVEKVAPTGAPVLILGETGTGKELIARAIHDLSPRRNGPLINVNCPAIPAALAESELFGHERGAFTDAVGARPGKFELADGGTIFLDEVADLSADLQVKLLRVLQEHETQRIGSSRVRKLDLRVVAATNRSLKEEMLAGHFREDLYYRLAAFVVNVPALRERPDDIPMLASYFLERASTVHQKPVTGFSTETLDLLSRYNWPGNIRELQNVIERAVLLCASDTIKPEHLGDLATARPSAPSFRLALREEKLRRVERALAQTGGNQAAAARLLGMSANNLARLMKNLGLKPPRAMH